MFGELRLARPASEHWSHDPALDHNRRQARRVRIALNTTHGLLPPGLKVVEVTDGGVTAISCQVRYLNPYSPDRIRELFTGHPIGRIILKFRGHVDLDNVRNQRIVGTFLRAFPYVDHLGIFADGSIKADRGPQRFCFDQIASLSIRGQRFEGRRLRSFFPSVKNLGFGDKCRLSNSKFAEMCGSSGWTHLRSLRLPALSCAGPMRFYDPHAIALKEEVVFSHTLVDFVPELTELSANFLPGSIHCLEHYGSLSALTRLNILWESLPTGVDLCSIGDAAPAVREIKTWARLGISTSDHDGLLPLPQLEGVVCDANVSLSALPTLGVLTRNARRIVVQVVDPVQWAGEVTRHGSFGRLDILYFRLINPGPNDRDLRARLQPVFPGTQIELVPDKEVLLGRDGIPSYFP